MKISELRKASTYLRREGKNNLAIKHIKKCNGSYKGVMELCGKLSVIAKMATCDDYWEEQVNRGMSLANWEVEFVLKNIE